MPGFMMQIFARLIMSEQLTNILKILKLIKCHYFVKVIKPKHFKSNFVAIFTFNIYLILQYS